MAQIGRAAQAGLPAAQFHLAQCYLDGTGLPRSITESVRWMTAAAEGEHAEAQFKLALLCMRGDAGMAERESSLADDLAADRSEERKQADPFAALLWTRRAAVNGSAEGQALLGYILTAGPEALRDEAEGERWYYASAKAGCPQGHLGLGLLHLRKQTPEDNRLAVAEIEQAAAAGLGDALFLLGALTHAGVAVPKNAERAVELYARAAEEGVVAAQTSFGLALLNGDGITRNPFSERHGSDVRVWQVTHTLPRSSVTCTPEEEIYPRTSPRPQYGWSELRRLGMPALHEP
ncbi:tetratricopeptide repeat protein [Methylobacterium phyllosphaerae]